MFTQESDLWKAHDVETKLLSCEAMTEHILLEFV